ncbi:MAG: hypothetical protein C0591_12310 [Marinilabiliales bacterium]|nr:MAG: hypothetical protein C0591_12310 [Marinilabiliales bacterium]
MLRLLNIIILFILFTTSCEKNSVGDCFKSTGPITIVDRQVSGFHTIMLKDNIDLELKSSNTNHLAIEAGSNLLSKIKTEVIDSVLIIENNNSCNWVRNYDSPLKAYLDFTTLDTIEYRSIGNISSNDTIRLNNLVINVREGAGEIDFIVHAAIIFCNIHYGTAEIRLRGRSKVCFVYSNSFGLVDNLELNSDQLYINNKSSNDVYVHANNVLEATIENIGSIYYTGNPYHLTLNQFGSGELIKLRH